MSDSTRRSEVPVREGDAELFAGPKPEPANRRLLTGAVAIAVLIAAAGGVAVMRRSPAPGLNTVLPTDPDAAKISFSELAMSESTSLSGGGVDVHRRPCAELWHRHGDRRHDAGAVQEQ